MESASSCILKLKDATTTLVSRLSQHIMFNICFFCHSQSLGLSEARPSKLMSLSSSQAVIVFSYG